MPGAQQVFDVAAREGREARPHEGLRGGRRVVGLAEIPAATCVEWFEQAARARSRRHGRRVCPPAVEYGGDTVTDAGRASLASGSSSAFPAEVRHLIDDLDKCCGGDHAFSSIRVGVRVTLDKWRLGAFNIPGARPEVAAGGT
jgi:hypothetical protein